MKRVLAIAFVLVGSSAALAANLNVSVRGAGGGSDVVMAGPGDTVNYEVFGQLSDDNDNEGIALFGFDLTTDCPGVVLPQATAPTAQPMLSFVPPSGIANPAGIGGTQQNGGLKQVGAGQNTIKNTIENAPFPIGTVLLGIGKTPGVVLISGSFTLSNTDFAECQLNLTNLFGNVIKDGETGEVFFKTEAFGVGTINNLTIRNVPDPEDPQFVSSSVACGSSLWQSQNNAVTLTFDRAVPAPATAAVQIRELLADGMYGPDLSAQFTLTANGNDIQLRENGTVLQHRHWYGITDTNPDDDGLGTFKVDLVVQVGDVNNDGRVVAADVSITNACIPCFNVPCPNNCDGFKDINGDDRIVAADVSLINSRIPSFNVAKPSGHACSP